MQILETEIRKEEFTRLSESEQVLLFQFGHACNEITYLINLLRITFDSNAEGLNKTIMRSRSMIVVRILVGKIFESWRMIERDFFNSKLSKDMEKTISQKGKESLDDLKEYFGKRNLMSDIRNNYSFHYSSAQFTATMSAIDGKQKFKLFLSKEKSNCLYAFAEDFITLSMMNKVNNSDFASGMDQIVSDAINVGLSMITFLTYTLSDVLILRIGKRWKEFPQVMHEIEPEYSFGEFSLPSFFRNR